MTEPRRFESTTATALARDASLPPDVLHDAARRVGALAAVLAIVWTVALLLNDVVGPLLGAGPANYPWWPTPGRYLCLASLGAALAVRAVSRRWTDRPGRVLDLGLGLEVVTALSVGLIDNYVLHLGVPGLSSIGGLLMVTPSLIPAAVRRRIAVSFVVATLQPATIAWAIWRGADVTGQTLNLIWAVIPTYLAAGIGLVPMLIIRRLGGKVKAARELGSYRLGQLIGRGGMGEVYRASHRLITRPAAVKLVRPELLNRSDPAQARTFEERFRREAEAAASLRSPNTIELYDYGVAADGTLFYVMELLEGYDWQTLVERFGPLPPERAVHLLTQACDSLAEAHDHGLIHRDIKPSNLFVCQLGVTSDVVKVLDFGLVRRELPGPAEPRLTNPEMPAGTPHFLPPEIIEAGAIDQRTDLYALGCVGYWLLTGTSVFEGNSPLPILFKHVSEVPVPPSVRVGHPIPPGLERLVLDCLAKDPRHRPRDAREVRRRLGEVDLTAPWTKARADAWWAAHASASMATPPRR